MRETARKRGLPPIGAARTVRVLDLRTGRQVRYDLERDPHERASVADAGDHPELRAVS